MPEGPENAIQGGLTKQEVADALRVSVRSVERLVADGELRPFKIGKRFVRFDQADVAAYLERQRANR